MNARPGPRYGTAHIVAVTDGKLHPRLVHQWKDQGLLEAELAPTPTRPLRFTFGQVVALALMLRLRELAKMDLSVSAGFVRRLIPHFEGADPLGRMLINLDTGDAAVVDGKVWRELNEGERLERTPEAFISLRLDSFVARIRTKLRQMEAAEAARDDLEAEMHRPATTDDYMELIDAELAKVTGTKGEGE